MKRKILKILSSCFGVFAVCGFSLLFCLDHKKNTQVVNAENNEIDVSFYNGISSVYGYKSSDNVDWYIRFDIRVNFHLTTFVESDTNSANYGLSYYHYYYIFYLDMFYNNVGWNSDFTSVSITDEQPYNYDYIRRQDSFNKTYSVLQVKNSSYLYQGTHNFYLNLENYFYVDNTYTGDYILVSPSIVFHISNSSIFRTVLNGLSYSPNLVFSTFLTESSYINSYNAGYSIGYEEGYTYGVSSQQEIITVSYDNGYDVGYAEGVSSQQSLISSSYDNGFQEGFDNGVISQEPFIANAYNDGYSDGYNEAYSSDFTVSTIFSNILLVGLLPVDIFLRMLNWEFLGINIASFVSALISVAATVIVIRLVTGKKNG